MSHAAERKEKDCLNCGTIIHGRYCHVCGQENIVPKESFWHLVVHFFYDITHFDSKFFDSLRYLIFKPGLLSKEYIKGRRASYLNPIKMYVFTSAIFFLIFFSLNGANKTFNVRGDDPYTRHERDSIIARLDKKLSKDSSRDNLRRQIALLSDTTKEVRPSTLIMHSEGFTMVGTIGGQYRDLGQYDSMQRALPSGERDGWLTRLWNKRAIGLNEKYKHDPTAAKNNIGESILHRLPYMLFVSLPFFALILKLLYIRRRQFYYVDHGIFSIHHYIFSFILLLLIFLVDAMGDWTGSTIWDTIAAILMGIVWPVYLFLAMKRFYGQNGWKTFIKFFLLNVLGLIVISTIAAFFFLFSIFQL